MTHKLTLSLVDTRTHDQAFKAIEIDLLRRYPREAASTPFAEFASIMSGMVANPAPEIDHGLLDIAIAQVAAGLKDELRKQARLATGADLESEPQPKRGGTRAEHLAWCKWRALGYLEEGNLREAVSSMISDVNKHPELEGTMRHGLGMIGMMTVRDGNPRAVREWIEGFN